MFAKIFIGILIISSVFTFGMIKIADHLNAPGEVWCRSHGYTVTGLPGRTLRTACLDQERRLIFPPN